MGRAVAAALAGRGTPPMAILGMPDSVAGHSPTTFRGAEIMFDFTSGDAVLQNVRAAIDGGVRRFVIGTTNWTSDSDAVEAMLLDNDASPASSKMRPGYSARSPSTTRTSSSGIGAPRPTGRQAPPSNSRAASSPLTHARRASPGRWPTALLDPRNWTWR
jgi:hypothetical protein